MISYNHDKYISQAIEGVLMQKTNFPIELVISDDFSSDNTQLIIEQYAAKNNKLINPIYRKINMGSMANFIDTFNYCSGKYIAICDGDDYWTDPYKLQKQVDFLEVNNEYGLVYTDIDFFYPDSNTFQRSIFKNRIISRTTSFEEHLIQKGFLAPCTWLCKREYLPSFEKSYADGSFAWLLDVFKQTKIYFYNEVTAVYRFSQESASRPSSPLKKFNYLKGVFQVQKDYILKYNVEETISKFVLSDSYISLLRDAIVFDDRAFIDESNLFFQQNQISSKSLFDLYKDNIRFEQELAAIRVSKAYRLGKFILKPLSMIRSKFKL